MKIKYSDLKNLWCSLDFSARKLNYDQKNCMMKAQTSKLKLKKRNVCRKFNWQRRTGKRLIKIPYFMMVLVQKYMNIKILYGKNRNFL